MGVILKMKRREFIQATAASILLTSRGVSAQNLGETITDAALRLNPFIQPEERVEKSEYDNSRPKEVRWEKLVCEATYPERKLLTGWDAFIEKLATSEYVPPVFSPLVRRDIKTTERDGFYFYFAATLACLKLPTVRPPRFVTTSGKYLFCGSSTQLIDNFVFPKGWVSFDCREIKLIEGNKLYHPSHRQLRPINPETGASLDVAPSLAVITSPIQYPGKDRKGSSLSFEEYLFFDIPHRPLRFRLELPPMIIQGVEIPMPTSYFEPYDIATGKWV